MRLGHTDSLVCLITAASSHLLVIYVFDSHYVQGEITITQTILFLLLFKNLMHLQEHSFLYLFAVFIHGRQSVMKALSNSVSH